MADNHNPPIPTDSPHVQPAPAFSTAAFARGLLRSALHLLIGAAVGAVLGFLVNSLLVFLKIWNGDVRLVTGAGLLAGVFFNRTILHALSVGASQEREVQAAAPAEQPTAAQAPPDGLRETVETIVFVIVLVLMLKSFDAEAFVIPTGSMAETLLGYQKWVECPSCGYKFPASCSQQVEPNEDGKTEWVSGCTCPNCRQHIFFTGRSDANPLAPTDVPDPDWGSGDRVLVSKFAYDLLERPPDRLDVVVFKSPGDGDERKDTRGDYLKKDHFPMSGPYKDGITMNFIKRLIGLPGEIIAIHDGDLYVLPSPPKDQPPRYDDLKDVPDPAAREQRTRELWQTQFMHKDDKYSIDVFNQGGGFQIVRKPPETILAMRRIVYDNDHPAKDLHAPRWTDRDKNGAWKADDAHGFRLTAPADDKPHWLGYRHRLRGAEDKDQLITDFMGYNTGEPPHSGPSGVNWVGDLILECDVQADQPAGELTLELSKGVDRFQARFDLASGGCSLLRVGQDKPLDSRPTALKGGGKHAVRFANVDQRLTVWVDDALPFGDGVPYEAPKTEGPTEKNDLEPAGVGLKGVGGAVGGLRLWRDTYYTTAVDGDPSAPDAGVGTWKEPSEAEVWEKSNPGKPKDFVDPADPTTWNKLEHLPLRTMYVQPGHYLCMGDNSPNSFDGRMWGLVPERLLLGKALDIYYPFDRFGRIR